MNGLKALTNRSLAAWSWITLAFTLTGPGALAQLPDEAFSARSHSGQFVIQAPRTLLDPPYSRLETNAANVRLDPTLLAISCERIKQNVWREIGAATGPWSGKIIVSVYPAIGPDEEVTIVSEGFRDGWNYRVNLPHIADKTRFVRGIVQACLQEYANRNTPLKTGELPRWLVEGITHEILTSSEITVILPPPKESPSGIRMTPAFFETRRTTLAEMTERPAISLDLLSFEELSWPSPAAFGGPTGERYRDSSLRFIQALQETPDGRARLGKMVSELPNYRNWQFAFLSAFRSDFRRPLDVEKWWTLKVMHLSSRGTSHAWTTDESWRKLDEALKYPVQVFAATNDLPMQAEVNLQAIVRDWKEPQQSLALQRTLNSLAQLRFRVAPPVQPAVLEYQNAIAKVLQEFADAGSKESKRRKACEKGLKWLAQAEESHHTLRNTASTASLQSHAPGQQP